MLFSDLERKLRDEISIETSQIKTSENEEKTETEKKLKIECGEVDVVSLEESKMVLEKELIVSSVALKGIH